MLRFTTIVIQYLLFRDSQKKALQRCRNKYSIFASSVKALYFVFNVAEVWWQKLSWCVTKTKQSLKWQNSVSGRLHWKNSFFSSPIWHRKKKQFFQWQSHYSQKNSIFEKAINLFLYFLNIFFSIFFSPFG